MSTRYGDVVRVLRAPLSAPGRNGVRLPLWADAVPSEPVRASVQPESSEEETTGRQTAITRWRLFAGPGTDLLATDRVLWDDLVLEVDGEVARWKHRGRPHHVEAVLKRAADS